ncbi:hypothetical protein FRC09_003922 [Ceratobasidium sp. 395]|nr:hypothetical protein FRC09_003922 [Ceratobasidium sp. 395]
MIGLQNYLASQASISSLLQFVSQGSAVPPIQPKINFAEFPVGIFSGPMFCGILSRWPDLQSAAIQRVDRFEKDSWPLYHQFLIFEVVYNDCAYTIRVETLGKAHNNQAGVEALVRSLLGPEFSGNSNIQVQVQARDTAADPSATTLLDHTPPANLLVSMATVDDLLFQQLSNRNNWHFTSVVPPVMSKVDDRETPSVKHLCSILRSFMRHAPDYSVNAENCYFLCRTVMQIITILTRWFKSPRFGYTGNLALAGSELAYAHCMSMETPLITCIGSHMMDVY